MRKAPIILLVICLFLVFGAVVSSYATEMPYKPWVMEKHAQRVSDRINNAIDDAVATNKIDLDFYIRYGLRDVSDFTNDRELFTNKEDGDAIWNIIVSDFTHQQPVGSVKPSILVKKDGSEVLYIFKDAEGNNVVLKATKNQDKWITDKKITKGKPVMSIPQLSR